MKKTFLFAQKLLASKTLSFPKILSGITVALVLTGCATVFLPKRQKVTIITNEPNAIVYLNNEELGTGAKITRRIERNCVQQIIVKNEGYRDKRAVLIPTHRAPGFWICQVFNLPFDLLYAMPTLLDIMSPKSMKYDKVNTLPEMSKYIVKKQDDKFLEISNISLEIKNKNKDIADWYIDYDSDLQSKIAEFERKATDREMDQAKKEKKKKKKKTLVDDDQNKLNYDDTKFSTTLYKTLKKTGFIDTVNKIFSDNVNTLVLEGKITRINYYQIKVKHDQGDLFKKINLFLTWYIKNSYNEVLDSVVTNQLSEDFLINKYDDPNYFEKIVGDAVELSYMKLHSNPLLTNHLKVISNLKISEPLLSIAAPKDVVTEKTNAQEASVIVKTKKGHGSGFAISNDGYIVTNYHVVSGTLSNQTNKITIITSDGTELEGKLVRSNKYRDLALIKVDQPFSKAFKCLNAKGYKNLLDVYTIGAPKSIELGQSISMGVISNERKTNNNNLLQLGMSVNSGNSGGPVFDNTGALHGVIVSKLMGQNTEGVSFAIPSYLLQEYLNINYN